MSRIFQLGVNNGYLLESIEAWLRSDCKADIRIRRAMTPGMCIIETEDALLSTEITRISDCKVNVKQINKKK